MPQTITTSEQIQAFLNISPSAQNDINWVTALWPVAEAVVQSRIGRNLLQNTYTEFYSGNGTRMLPLRNRPVTVVTTVLQDFSAYFGTNPDGAFNNPIDVLVQGADWCLDVDGSDGVTSNTGLLIRIDGVWSELSRGYQPRQLTADTSPVYGNLKITYTAGYAPGVMPIDLQYAVAYIVSFMKRTAPLGGVPGQERIGDYSYGLLEMNRNYAALAPELATADYIISKYRDFPTGW